LFAMPEASKAGMVPVLMAEAVPWCVQAVQALACDTGGGEGRHGVGGVRHSS
jgi:hypothetical protein